jgi:hypothetical protein
MLPRSTFRRAERPARVRAAAVPIPVDQRRGVIVRCDAGTAADAKTEPKRNRALLDLARGMPCLLRISGVCQGGAETTVAAHSNQAIHGKAGARKADDQYSAWACMACHCWLDSGSAPRTEKDRAFERGHLRQVEAWRLIATDPKRPQRDRDAAQWALTQLNATPSFDPFELDPT